MHERLRSTEDGQDATSAQAAFPGPRESAQPPATDGARRSPDAKIGAHDGSDDAWDAAGQWLWCRCWPGKLRSGEPSRGDFFPFRMARQQWEDPVDRGKG
jgi:hypothetical protein